MYLFAINTKLASMQSSLLSSLPPCYTPSLFQNPCLQFNMAISFLSLFSHTPTYPSLSIRSSFPSLPSSFGSSHHLLFAFIPFVLLSKAKSNLFRTPTFPTCSFSFGLQLYILFHTLAPSASPHCLFCAIALDWGCEEVLSYLFIYQSPTLMRSCRV